LKGVSLFDVSGHGISSGLITVLAKSIMHRNISSYNFTGLGRIIKNINEELVKEIENVDNYLSGIVMLFNGSQIEYINAGHSDLLIKRKDKRSVKEVKPRDTEVKGGLLGLNTISTIFDVIQFTINPGDVLFLYTDGLNETQNSSNEPFGHHRIIETLNEAPIGSAPEILDFFLNRFNAFIEGNEPADDITTIVLQRK
jgi:sigma-B regulation protein RsbU (phosphoserine phosphatase)